mmetsp:Transcript_7271/g.10917  ORF Transcript_7271/g.10917 Transcript_7271/m.10917 type:complete len:186 (+) Transcript_7271:77-634(+)
MKTDDHEKCEAAKEFAVIHNPKVIFLLDHIKKLGCTLPSNFFSCEKCDKPGISGGYIPITKNNPDPKVVICEDKQINQLSQLETMGHELIHVYDSCRAHVDLTNLKQHACTEIRASNLSGECSWTNEINRGNFNLKLQHQNCVKRRAVLSVSENPQCKDKDEAMKVVEQVFQRCYKDTSPYDRNP